MLRRTFIKLAATGSLGMCAPTLARAGLGSNELTVTADRRLHRVTLRRPDGGEQVLGGMGTDPGCFNAPRAAVVSGERIFVLDSGNSRVQVFDLEGRFVRTFGRFGRARGELAYPGAMISGGDGTVIVADTLNHRVVRYREDGSIVGYVSTGLNGPRGLRLDHAGDLHVSDSERVIRVGGFALA